MELTQRLAHSVRCIHSAQPLLQESLPRKRTLEAVVDSPPTAARASTLTERARTSSGLAYKREHYLCSSTSAMSLGSSRKIEKDEKEIRINSAMA